MSVVLRTCLHTLCLPTYGMVQFEHEDGSPDGEVKIWFCSWGGQNGVTTWNALRITEKPTPFSRSVAREIWKDLVEAGFSDEYTPPVPNRITPNG